MNLVGKEMAKMLKLWEFGKRRWQKNYLKQE